MSCVQLFAHEVRPAVAEIEFKDGKAVIKINMNAEGFAAGIDLSSIENTDLADNKDIYDNLRSLESEAFKEQLQTLWPKLQDQIILKANGVSLTPELRALTVPPVGDVELLRDTVFNIEVDLPENAESVQFGWASELGAIAVRQTGVEEGGYTGYLTNGSLTAPIKTDGTAAQTDALSVFLNYIVIGFEHIIPKGLDHILFVLGLFFLSMRFKPILLQVTAFTIAHSVTLALATLELVVLPASIIEPLIALSIVYVAIENIFAQNMTKWRVVVIFAFGLLHGLGFASVLGDIGLDPTQFITGLIAFNIGVELGQLAVIFVAFITVGIWFSKKDWYRKVIAIPASLVIAFIGFYWFIERTLF